MEKSLRKSIVFDYSRKRVSIYTFLGNDVLQHITTKHMEFKFKIKFLINEMILGSREIEIERLQ